MQVRFLSCAPHNVLVAEWQTHQIESLAPQGIRVRLSAGTPNMTTIIAALNSDELTAVLNAMWSTEYLILIAFIISPRLRRYLRARFWS